MMFLSVKKNCCPRAIRCCFFLLCIYSALPVFAQQLPPSRMVTGRLLDSITHKPVADVIVANKSTSKTTLSNADGYYYISAGIKDSLVFYLIGYYPRYFYFHSAAEFNKQVLLSFLRPNVEELKEIEITAEKLKKENDPHYPFNQTPANIGSPLTFLYERYSKKYKQYRKIEALEQEKQQRRLREGRFTREFVMSITDIEEDEVDDFMKKCRFSNEFLENANDYDFILAVKKKYLYYSDRH